MTAFHGSKPRWEERHGRHVCTLGDHLAVMVWEPLGRQWVVDVDGSVPIHYIDRPKRAGRLTEDDWAEARGCVEQQLRKAQRGTPPPKAPEPTLRARSGRPKGQRNTIHRRVGALELSGGMRAQAHCGIAVLLSSATDQRDAVTCGRCRQLADNTVVKGYWTTDDRGAKLPSGKE